MRTLASGCDSIFLLEIEHTTWKEIASQDKLAQCEPDNLMIVGDSVSKGCWRLSLLIMGALGQADRRAGPPTHIFVCKYFLVLTQQQSVFTHREAKNDSSLISLDSSLCYVINSYSEHICPKTV